MDVKKLITVVLLVFVLSSGVYLVFQETMSGPGEGELTAGQGARMDAGNRAAPVEEGEYASDCRVIAYYFHGDTRCMTCRKIEAYTYEALLDHFPKAIDEGVIEWRVVNVDEPGNEHFIEDFQQASLSVVLVDNAEGGEANWKTLQRVWELVGDREKFQDYVRIETAAFLEGSA